jgi:putative endonuclease
VIYQSGLSNTGKRMIEGFTKERGCKLLVWYEAFDDLQEARGRELQMKK